MCRVCAPAAEGSDCESTLPAHCGSVTRCNSRLQRIPPPPPLAPGQPGFVPALVPGTKRLSAGYPTLRTLSVAPELRHAGVEVLGQASKKESLVLAVKVGGAFCFQRACLHLSCMSLGARRQASASVFKSAGRFSIFGSLDTDALAC
jgi:hypothetical protein